MGTYKSVFAFQTNSNRFRCIGVIADYDRLALKKMKTFFMVKDGIVCNMLLYKKGLLKQKVGDKDYANV
jgi:hypothetical protein